MSTLTLEPLWSGLPRLRRGNPRLTWHDAGVERRVLCPEEQGERSQAVYLPGQLERVRASEEHTSLAEEHIRIRPGQVTHGAAIAVRYRNAYLIDGVFYGGGLRFPMTPERHSVLGRLLPRHVPQRFARAALPTTVFGCRFFGHRILDDVVSGMLARELAPVVWTDDGEPSTEHIRHYTNIAGLPERGVRSAFFEEAWVMHQDFAQNASKRARLEELRARIRSTSREPRRGHGVFFRRRTAGAARLLTNEAAIEDLLAVEGFEIIDVAAESAQEIIERCRGASVMVGVDGSAQTHGLLAIDDGAAFVNIQPPCRFNNIWKDYTDAMGMTYGFVVCEGNEDGFALDADELLRTLDLVRNEAERRSGRARQLA